MTRVEPTFIGVGGQKCATTWLAECLRAHPMVFMSSPKEIDYFGSRRRGHRSLDWYLNHFAAGAGYTAIGEFSTRYLTKPSSLQALAKALPKVKIIVSLRKPVDRFISAWKHSIRSGVLSKGEYSVMNRDTLARAQEIAPNLFSDGLYSQGLKGYLESFGAAGVHVILKDQVDGAPALVLERLYRFLGVDPSYLPAVSETRVSRGIMPRSVGLETLRRKVYQVAKYRFPWLIDLGHSSGASDLFRRLNARRGEALLIEPEALRELHEFYKEEVGILRGLLGVELTGW